MLSRKLIVLLLLLSLLPLSVHAQAPLTAEQEALAARFLAAFETVNAYQSYIEDSIETTTQNGELLNNGAPFQSLGNTTTKITNTIVDRTNQAAAQTITLTVSDSTIETGGYALEGELRYVDGVMYGRGSYTENDYFEELPNEWVEVEAGGYELFLLDPDSLLDALTEPAIPFESLEELLTAITDISSGTTTFDGAEVEQIDIRIERDGLLNLLNADEEDVEGMGAMFEFMDDDSSAVISIYINADGNVVYAEMIMSVSIFDLDFGEMDETMAGFTISVVIESSQSSTFSQINTVTTPITAP